MPPETTPSATLFSSERKAILSTTKQSDKTRDPTCPKYQSITQADNHDDDPPDKKKAQEAGKEQLEALQQIEKQRLLKKKQQDEERKQAEIEAKQRQDAEAKEQMALVQPTSAVATVPPSNDQHDPDINRHLFNLNSSEFDNAPDLNDRSPPSCKQRSMSGLVVARRISPTNQAPPAKPSKCLALNDPPPSTSASSPMHYHQFRRIILKLSVILKTEKGFNKFVQLLTVFMVNAKMVNPHFVWDPIAPDAVGLANITSKG